MIEDTVKMLMESLANITSEADKVAKGSDSIYNQIENNKDKFTPQQLAQFEAAQKTVEDLKQQAKNLNIKI
jgi:hypothetical protein